MKKNCYPLALSFDPLCSVCLIEGIDSVVQWSEFLATDPEVWVSFPALQDSPEKQWVWNEVNSAS
jgi:hypothetical protein